MFSMRWPTDGKFGFRSRLARSRISECLACIGSAVGTSFPAHCLSPLRAAGRFRDRPDCSGGGLRCCCGRRYLFPVARQSPGGGRNLHSGSRGASITATFGSIRRLDAVLNPLGHDPLPLKRRYSRLPLYLGIALFCTAAVGYGIWQYGEWMRLPFVGDSEKQEVLRCRGRFIRPGKNRERNSRSHRR